MFSAIAYRYDFLNHFLSLSIDKQWRRKAVALLGDCLAKSNALCLDLCCGTGDLALEMAKSGQAQVIGCDFSHPMLRQCSEKILKRNLAMRIRITEADALNLPFRDQTFDATAIAFGLRNLDSVTAGLAEMGRVLKPGGKLIVLEFSRPSCSLFERLFRAYFFHILPRVGNSISRHKYAYTYLPASVSQFPHQSELARILADCGLKNPGYLNLSGGIAAIHYAEKK